MLDSFEWKFFWLIISSENVKHFSHLVFAEAIKRGMESIV